MTYHNLSVSLQNSELSKLEISAVVYRGLSASTRITFLILPLPLAPQRIIYAEFHSNRTQKYFI